MVHDLIEKQRLIIAGNIVNSFQKDNDIEKAALYRTHKYIKKVLDAKTGKMKYVYIDPSDVERIKGNRKDKTKDRNKRMEIIIDKRGKSLLKYKEEDVVQVQELLSKIPDVNNIKRSVSTSENTQSIYLNFKLHGHPYKIRISDHTATSHSNEVIFGIRNYIHGTWIIDTCVGRYKPEDVAIIVKNLDTGLEKYKSNEERKRLTGFVNRKLKEYEENDDELHSDEEVLQFARDYMNERRINDDKYGTKLQILQFLIHRLLEWRE